jgi:hypothetical protein
MSEGIGDMAAGILEMFNAAKMQEAMNNGDNPWATYNDYLQKILDQYNAIGTPQLRNANAEQTGPSAYDSLDPATRNYQMLALDKLGQEASSKGLTAEDIAAQQQALQNAGRMEAGLRGASQQRAAATGMGGSMSAQLAALQGQQAAVNQANSNAVDIAGQNRQRYMQALAQMGAQAGAVRGQDQAKAAAQNQINQFNTGMRWQAQQYNLNLPQQDWNNKMTLAGKKANAWNDLGQGAIDAWKAKFGLADQLAKGARDYGQGMQGYAKSFTEGL